MLYNIIRFLIENKFIAFLLGLLLVVAGYITAPFDWQDTTIPRAPIAVDAIPDIGENQQIIFTKWAGQSPQEIQDQITYPLTTALMGIAGIKTIRSSSMFGFSSIYLIFEEDVDFYWSRTRILEKLNSLPPHLLPPNVTPNLGPDATGIGQIFWYTIEGIDAKGNPTGGWDLDEIRSVQDYFIKYELASSKGVAEVASIGGMVKTYKIAVDPAKLKYYKIPLQKVVAAVQKTNQNSSVKTMEINRVEYIIRGMGEAKTINDLENTVVATKNNASILISDIAKVYTAPKERRGILDKEGSEAVGGVVTARYGANPMEVIKGIKEKINTLSAGLPQKKLADGRVSKLTIVPFYDRGNLISETIDTLSDALFLELLITVLVIMIMIADLRIAGLVSGLLPLTILMVFIAMKFLGVTANIVALSGIAIAIGTVVDMGIILAESILKRCKEHKGQPINKIVFEATKDVSGAIITAVMTTVISFMPIFAMDGAAGKLFVPLAATKTIALIMAILATLFILPPLAAFLLGLKKTTYRLKIIIQSLLIILSGVLLYWQPMIGIAGILYGSTTVVEMKKIITKNLCKKIQLGIIIFAILGLLTKHWMPLGVHSNSVSNFIFVGVICGVILGGFYVFQKYYEGILSWALENKKTFLTLPLCIILCGVWIWKHTENEFMPTLNEGSFLLMPTSLPQAGVRENKRVLQHLDAAVMQLPEIETVVGKSGRTESSLDPAPLSMYENIINYFPEYKTDTNGKLIKFKTDAKGLFLTRSGKKISAGTRVQQRELIPDENGAYYRNWRAHIKTSDDIWQEIVRVTKLPGVTSAPKLQPIQTRLVMLQTGMRSPMGIKIKSDDLKKIEAFGKALEPILKGVKGIKKATVFADKITGKPTITVKINREKLIRYGLQINTVQNILQTAVGGKTAGQIIEGSARYDIEIRYPRELRNTPESLLDIYVPLANGNVIPLSEVASIAYEKSAQVIKSEDNFLVGYVLFDKEKNNAETTVVERAKKAINTAIKNGQLTIPQKLSYRFSGTYEQQIKTNKKLMMIVPLVLVIILFILYLQFRSLTVTLMIFSGIAVAFSGGFLMIWLYGKPWFFDVDFFGVSVRTLFQIEKINLSVAVWVGFIALFGIATDDGVLMATHLKKTFEKKNGTSTVEIREKVIEAGKRRLRPCLMTTATTLIALLPILTSTGKGSEIMIPMAIPSFGGMSIALITLFVVPVLFAMHKEYSLKKDNL